MYAFCTCNARCFSLAERTGVNGKAFKKKGDGKRKKATRPQHRASTYVCPIVAMLAGPIQTFEFLGPG
jgi:hypothetical protein